MWMLPKVIRAQEGELKNRLVGAKNGIFVGPGSKHILVAKDLCLAR